MNTTYMTAKQVTEKFNVTSMTLHRWLKRSEMKFPRPTYINGRRYFITSEIEDWETGMRFASDRSAA